MPGELYLNRGIFGHDYGSTLWPTSTWYPVYVHPTGCVEVCGTLDISGDTATVTMAGTADVDIKTLGGSLVPAGPLPVDVESFTPGGTQDVDIKTIGGSLIPSGSLPVNATCSTVHATQVGYWTSRIYGYDGANWDELKTTEYMAGGTIDAGLLAVGRVPPADPVEKIASFTAAASTVAVWTPAAGKRWNLTDFVISAKNATDVALYDGTTSTKAIFYFADNGGVVMDLQTPFISTGTNTPLRISLTASTLSITTSGYETS